MNTFRSFSDKYLKSLDSLEEKDESYFSRISNIANNIFEIKVYCQATDVSHNFDNNYQELIQILLAKHNYHYFGDIEKITPFILTCHNFKNSANLPDNCISIIDEFIPKNIYFEPLI